MAQQQRIGKGNTTVTNDNGVISVTFHSTEVVRVTATTITLKTGGWKSATTKTRMNQTSNQFGLSFQVYQKAREWFVDTNGTTLKFDGDVLEFARAEQPA